MTGVGSDVAGVEGALVIVSKDNVYRNQDGLAVVYDDLPSALEGDGRQEVCRNGLESLKSLAQLHFDFRLPRQSQSAHKRAKPLYVRACCTDLFTCFALTGLCGLSIIAFVLCPLCFELAVIVCGGGIIECTRAVSCCITRPNECGCA